MEANRRVIASPCTNVCRLDELGKFCVGCRRTLAEIEAWPAMTEADKRRVLERLAERSPTRAQ